MTFLKSGREVFGFITSLACVVATIAKPVAAASFHFHASP
jgi:hypothetical protein